MTFIPYSLPWITEREAEAVATALYQNKLSGTTANLSQARETLQRFFAGQPVLLTTSCTAALELALKSLNLQSGDEVIVSDFTFIATASAVVEAGGTPVFVDIEEDTYNFSLPAVKAALTPKTKAVIAVHYNGISCDLDALLALLLEQNIPLIEDAAHGLGALYKNRPIGTIGAFGCVSFHDTKNIVAGEGGAIIINAVDMLERTEWIYEKGTNRSQFLRGEIDKYTWISRGSSYPMSGLLAALLKIQLDRHDEIRTRRKHIVEHYEDGLSALQDEGILRLQTIPAYATIPYHIACFTLTDIARRDELLAHLRERNIAAYFHYQPLTASPFAMKNFGTHAGQCPVSMRVAGSIVRLPLYPQMSDDTASYILACVHEFFHPTSSRAIQPEVVATTKNDAQYDVSIVIPCYNEAPHLRTNISELIHVLDGMHLSYEILLIDDGSTDETSIRIRECCLTHPHHSLRSIFHTKNVGRGGTVTEGIHLAKGRFVGFLDIDLEVHARYIPAALIALERGKADMVLAERFYRFQLFAWKRWLMSRGYRWLVQHMLNTPSLDTEAGFKFFRRNAILRILDHVQDQHWFWDTEITIRALDAKLRLHREPVLFDRNEGKQSTVKALRDSVRMFHALRNFAKLRKLKNIS